MITIIKPAFDAEEAKTPHPLCACEVAEALTAAGHRVAVLYFVPEPIPPGSFGCESPEESAALDEVFRVLNKQREERLAIMEEVVRFIIQPSDHEGMH